MLTQLYWHAEDFYAIHFANWQMLFPPRSLPPPLTPIEFIRGPIPLPLVLPEDKFSSGDLLLYSDKQKPPLINLHPRGDRIHEF